MRRGNRRGQELADTLRVLIRDDDGGLPSPGSAASTPSPAGSTFSTPSPTRTSFPTIATTTNIPPALTTIPVPAVTTVDSPSPTSTSFPPLIPPLASESTTAKIDAPSSSSSLPLPSVNSSSSSSSSISIITTSFRTLTTSSIFVMTTSSPSTTVPPVGITSVAIISSAAPTFRPILANPSGDLNINPSSQAPMKQKQTGTSSSTSALAGEPTSINGLGEPRLVRPESEGDRKVSVVGVAAGTVGGFAMVLSVILFLWKWRRRRPGSKPVAGLTPTESNQPNRDHKSNSRIMDELIAAAYAAEGGGNFSEERASAIAKSQHGEKGEEFSRSVPVIPRPPPARRKLNKRIGAWLQRQEQDAEMLNPMSARASRISNATDWTAMTTPARTVTDGSEFDVDEMPQRRGHD